MVNEIEYSQVTELSERFKKAARVFPKLADAWLLHDVGKPLEREMQATAPVDTGNLRDHIRCIHEPMEVRVGAIGVEYARYVSEGTASHEIKPVNKPYLVFKVNGKMVVAKKVQHPGTKANPYQEVATAKVLDRALPKLMQIGSSLVSKNG